LILASWPLAALGPYSCVELEEAGALDNGFKKRKDRLNIRGTFPEAIRNNRRLYEKTLKTRTAN